MASKQLSCSLACSTQVVLEHETRCLNVKLLIFLALHYITQKYSLETQCGRSECVPEEDEDGEEDGIGEETSSPNKRRMSRVSPEQRITFSSPECEKSVVAEQHREYLDIKYSTRIRQNRTWYGFSL
jgi:hypothetical protein